MGGVLTCGWVDWPCGCALAAVLRVVVERVIASERPQDAVVHKEDHSCLC